MRKFGVTLLPLALAAIGFVAAPGMAVAENMAHAHMGHVTEGWNDTPDGKGLLPTAIVEAKIAVFHAGLAAKKADDLDWMQSHIRHVLHAIDPSLEAKGPGKGYGVLKAASGVAKHITIASQSDGATDNIRAHAVHTATTAENTVGRAERIAVLGKMVLAANNAADAAGHVNRVAMLADQLLAGIDADGDGEIGWTEGEGGLMAAEHHMEVMEKGEGMY